VTAPAKRARPELPTSVEQLRILLWLQFFLMLLNSLPLFIYEAVLQNREDAAYDTGGLDSPIYTTVSHRADQVGQLALWMVAIAALLGISAGLTRRGWLISYPLVLLAQIAAVAGLVYLLRDEIYLGLGVALVLAIGVCVLVVLFRPEVWRFIRGRGIDPVKAR
jgi:hypothetical protein